MSEIPQRQASDYYGVTIPCVGCGQQKFVTDIFMGPLCEPCLGLRGLLRPEEPGVCAGLP